jgi:hypothetical protein
MPEFYISVLIHFSKLCASALITKSKFFWYLFQVTDFSQSIALNFPAVLSEGEAEETWEIVNKAILFLPTFSQQNSASRIPHDVPFLLPLSLYL